MIGKYYQQDDLLVYNNDFLTMRTIRESSIDLIVTSPPYNLDIAYKSFDDSLPYDKYLALYEKWLRKCYKVLKDDGRICLNIP